jgi:hypothetical protein
MQGTVDYFRTGVKVALAMFVERLGYAVTLEALV